MARVPFLALSAVLFLSLSLPSAFGSSRRELWNVDTQLEKMFKYLYGNGYDKFASLLQKYGADVTMMQALQEGTKITVLAPPDEAFDRIPMCYINIQNALLDHVIPQYLPRRCFNRAPVGAVFPTFGRDSAIKSANDPIIVKLKRGAQPRFANANNATDVSKQAADASKSAADVSGSKTAEKLTGVQPGAFNPVQGNTEAANIGNGALSTNVNTVYNVNNGNSNNVNVNGAENDINVDQANIIGDENNVELGRVAHPWFADASKPEADVSKPAADVSKPAADVTGSKTADKFNDAQPGAFDPTQGNTGAGNVGNGPLSTNVNAVYNVNNGNINNVNVNGNNNNVQINNYNNNNGDDSYGVDYGDYNHSDDYGDAPDGVSCVQATVVALNIFRKRSIVVHAIDNVLALCGP